MTLSAATEDYLKTIYKLSGAESGEVAGVTTQAIADRLGVTPPSATAMVKKLASLQLITHEPYRGVMLCPAGEAIALEVIRHHRLIETFLSEVLGMEWDEVHEEAEKWEHVLSEAVEDRMDAALNSPTHDPHGAPIPTRDGFVPDDGHCSLLEAAQTAGDGSWIVRRVSDRDGATLRFLREAGLVPGARLIIENFREESGVVQWRLQDKEDLPAHLQVLGVHPASAVRVSRVESAL